ncbi:MAG: DUF3078 domain-containing protein [Chlorobi bacterium]|nr:DUF3078 domain-containing protein [Chlorobiota bacterium]
MKPFPKHWVILLMAGILVAIQAGGELFGQKNKKINVPDSLKIERKDTTSLFLNDSTLKQKWEKGGKAGVTLAQVYLVNWVSGGESSLSGVAQAHLFAKRLRKTSLWENTLDARLGYVGQGKIYQKTTDRLDIVTSGRVYLKEKWFYAWRVNLRTQMLPGYGLPGDSVIISNFLSPGYMYINLGFDYHPFKGHTLLLAPLSSKVTIVADQELANKGAFGVIMATFDVITNTILSFGQNLKYEFGGFVRYTFKGQITPTTSLETRLELFSNYLKKPQNVDIDWEVLGKVKISDKVSVNLYTHLIYDDDIKMETDNLGNVIRGPKVQFQEILGLGLTLNFSNEK